MLLAPDYGYCAACSEEGRAIECDPFFDSGCPEGSCYILPLVSGQHAARCVCPVGTATIDTPCQQTQDCQPGLVCAASLQQCRPLCHSDEDCQTSGAGCLFFDEGIGYCDS